MAGVICLIVVANDSNHFHESLSGKDHFNNSRIGTISHPVVLPIGRKVFVLNKYRAGSVVIRVNNFYVIY